VPAVISKMAELDEKDKISVPDFRSVTNKKKILCNLTKVELSQWAGIISFWIRSVIGHWSLVIGHWY
jgi:hypothetical protein